MLDIMYISHAISYIFHMSGCMYSNVELNFGMDLFSSIFQSWYERGGIGIIAEPV